MEEAAIHEAFARKWNARLDAATARDDFSVLYGNNPNSIPSQVLGGLNGTVRTFIKWTFGK